RPSGQLGLDPRGSDAAGQLVAMVAIAGNDGVTGLERHLHADDDRLLADIEVAEPPDQAHSVELTGLFLEPPDEQHVAKRGQLLLFGEVGHRARRFVAGTALGGRRNGRFVGGYRHMAPQEKGRLTSVIGPTPLSRNCARAKAHGGRCGLQCSDRLLHGLWGFRVASTGVHSCMNYGRLSLSTRSWVST